MSGAIRLIVLERKINIEQKGKDLVVFDWNPEEGIEISIGGDLAFEDLIISVPTGVEPEIRRFADPQYLPTVVIRVQKKKGGKEKHG